jgi:hypothetical protein
MSDWTIDRDKIIDAIETLGLVPSRPGIATSEFICIRPKKNRIKMMMASEVSGYVIAEGKGRWPFEKDVYIDRRLLDPFIMAAKNIKSKSDFKFTKTGKDELTVKNGTRKAKLTCSTPRQGYADIKTKGREVKKEKEFNSMLVAAKQCADNETSTPELNCVYVKKKGDHIQFYSTTGKAMFRAEVKSKLKLKEPIPVPLFIIDLFANQNLIGVEATDKDVVLDFGNGKIWQTIAVHAKNKFPWKRIDEQMKKEAKNSELSFIVDAKMFGTTVSRLSSYLGSVRRLDWVLKLKGSKGSNSLEMLVPLGHTEFKDKILVNKTIDRDFEVDWPLDRLQGIIEVMASTQNKLYVHFDKDNRAYIKTHSIELLVSRRTN